MKTFSKVNDLKQELSKLNPAGIGFVPTMGALHAGHRSLVEMARRECETVVVSVFVNPTQFNDKNDLRNYPRTPEADAALLEAAGADYVLMPSVEEIYPEPDTRLFDFGQIELFVRSSAHEFIVMLHGKFGTFTAGMFVQIVVRDIHRQTVAGGDNEDPVSIRSDPAGTMQHFFFAFLIDGLVNVAQILIEIGRFGVFMILEIRHDHIMTVFQKIPHDHSIRFRPDPGEIRIHHIDDHVMKPVHRHRRGFIAQERERRIRAGVTAFPRHHLLAKRLQFRQCFGQLCRTG